MKISKNKQTVKANVNAASRYDKAQKYIQSAIDILTEESLESADVVASESIANLSVVMLDLRGSKKD